MLRLSKELFYFDSSKFILVQHYPLSSLHVVSKKSKNHLTESEIIHKFWTYAIMLHVASNLKQNPRVTKNLYKANKQPSIQDYQTTPIFLIFLGKLIIFM